MAYKHRDFGGSVFPRIYSPDGEVALLGTSGEAICETGGSALERWHFLCFVRPVLCTHEGPGTAARTVWCCLSPKWSMRLV